MVYKKGALGDESRVVSPRSVQLRNIRELECVVHTPTHHKGPYACDVCGQIAGNDEVIGKSVVDVPVNTEPTLNLPPRNVILVPGLLEEQSIDDHTEKALHIRLAVLLINLQIDGTHHPSPGGELANRILVVKIHDL